MARADGAFERIAALPCDLEIDRIESSVRNGVLTVRLPKAGLNRPASLQLC
jgi:HSP20 family molecular chaperone IbpA